MKKKHQVIQNDGESVLDTDNEATAKQIFGVLAGLGMANEAAGVHSVEIRNVFDDGSYTFVQYTRANGTSILPRKKETDFMTVNEKRAAVNLPNINGVTVKAEGFGSKVPEGMIAATIGIALREDTPELLHKEEYCKDEDCAHCAI